MAAAFSLPPASALAQISAPQMNHPAPTVNILLTTFAGLGLPRTLSLPTSSSTAICDVVHTIRARLPPDGHRLIITTNSNRQLLSTCKEPISSLTQDDATILPLRLSSRLCGGKGGFGSQLRAAGGRMSSRKNRNNQAAASGSNRNLDGRRLRTIDEAKRLAEYLAIKPEMDKKEKEERKKRWEAVVEAADRREEEIKSGKLGANGGRLDNQYVESKEEAEERTREAVMRAMRQQGVPDEGRTGSESSVGEDEAGSDEMEGGEGSESSSDDDEMEGTGLSFFGWDEEDDPDDGVDDGDGNEDVDRDGDAVPGLQEPAYEGKGKGKV